MQADTLILRTGPQRERAKSLSINPFLYEEFVIPKDTVHKNVHIILLEVTSIYNES